MKGLFITFEGIDGCGKTTQIKKIYSNLQKLNYPVLLTREPGGTKIAEKIRQLLLNPIYQNMNWRTELLLYTAARVQHLEEKIWPALRQGKIVICDRFYDATIAYQGYGRRLPLNLIQKLHQLVCNNFQPNLTFILDLPVKIAQQRLKRSGKKRDRLEKEQNHFQQRVRKGYLSLAKQHPRRCHLINATQEIKLITEEIMQIILASLKKIKRSKNS